MQTQTTLRPWLKALFTLLLCALVLPATAQLPRPMELPGPFKMSLTGFQPLLGQDATVLAVARQADGKVLIGGRFSQVNSVPRQNIARLNADGSTDAGFNPGLGTDAPVHALAVQPDGKVVIGGEFTQVNGVARRLVARLNPDGSLDTAFNELDGPYLMGTTSPAVVHALAIQDNGGVVAGGKFRVHMMGEAFGLIRFFENGQHDAGFYGHVDANNPSVRSLVALPGSKLLVGGLFTHAGSAADGVGRMERDSLVRLLPGGQVDTAFSANDAVRAPVAAMAVQPDGRIVVGAHLFECNMVPGANYHCMSLLPGYVQRLQANGQADASFTPHALEIHVWTVSLDRGGNVLVGGGFQKVDGTDRPYLALFDAHGTPMHDYASFPTPDRPVYAAAYGDGNWVIGGGFGRVSTQVRQGVAQVRFGPPMLLDKLPRPFYGRCGLANGVPTSVTPPMKDRCAAGTNRVIIRGSLGTGTSSYLWTCQGLISSAHCSAPFVP